MSPARIALSIALVAASCWPRSSGADARPPPAFAVIVSADVAGTAVTPESTSLIYRRRQTHWADGRRAEPVNLPATNPLRREFSRCMLGEAPESMDDYWREMYYHGVLPPHVVESERAVVLFVAATPGAIGYVASCPKEPGVSVVFTIGRMPGCAGRVRSCSGTQDS